MATIDVLKSSRFLSKEDVGTGKLVTIKDVTRENVAMENDPTEFKYCLHFEEMEKPLVLNSINGQLIAGFLNEREMDNWLGKKIVLYVDPNVTMGGKLVGGIRARAPKPQGLAPTTPAPKPTPRPVPKPAPAPDPEAEPPADDDVPF